VSIHNNVSHYVHILIRTNSVEFQPTMKVNIRNQCADFKLTNRRYFNSDVQCNKDPDGEVDTGSMKSIDFLPFLSMFEGALMHTLQGKHIKASNLPESMRIRLLIAWKSEGYKKFQVFVHLIEYDKAFYWDKLSYEKYYRKYASQLRVYDDPIKDTWLMPNGTVLATELELDFTQRDGVLNVTVSEGIRDEHTKRPEWIRPER
jgi:hypothetical protein